jgi:hypothetical protein
LHGALGAFPQRLGAAQHRIAQVGRVGGVGEAAHLEVACGVRHQAQVLAHIPRRCAVVAPQKLVDEPRVVLVRVPQQLRQQPRLEFCHLAPVRLVRALLEHPAHMVLMEKAQVRPQHEVVRVGQQVVREVGRVVPHIEAIAAFAPAAQVVGEARVVGSLQRLRETALDGTQAHDHIRARAQRARRLARVPIRQRIEGDMRELALQSLGDEVHRLQYRRDRAAFALFDGTAAVALALAPPILLRDGDDLRLRVLAQDLAHALHQKRPQLGVRPAQLRLLPAAFAVDEAVPVGVLLKVGLRGHKPERGMHEADILDFAPVSAGEGRAVPVGVVAGSPVAVEGVVPERLTILEGGLLASALHGDAQIALAGDVGCPRRPPAHAQPVQESVHGVERPARATACKQQIVPRAFNDGFLRAESVRAKIRAQPFGERAVPDHNRAFGQGVSFAHFEGRACDLR